MIIVAVPLFVAAELFIRLVVMRDLGASRRKPQPRTRCSNCGEIYYGDKCPMCGEEF